MASLSRRCVFNKGKGVVQDDDIFIDTMALIDNLIQYQSYVEKTHNNPPFIICKPHSSNPTIPCESQSKNIINPPFEIPKKVVMMTVKISARNPIFSRFI